MQYLHKHTYTHTHTPLPRILRLITLIVITTIPTTERHHLDLTRRRVNEDDDTGLLVRRHAHDPDRQPVRPGHLHRLEPGLVSDDVQVRRLGQDERVGRVKRVACCSGEKRVLSGQPLSRHAEK